MAAILFSIFFYFHTRLILDWSTRASELVEHSVLRSLAHNTWLSVFGSEGIPSDWHAHANLTPVAIGLRGHIYRIPLSVNETNGTERITTINASLSFDPDCELLAWEASVRVYDQVGNELVSDVYNASYCTPGYLKAADMVLNTSFLAYEAKLFFVYFSPQELIRPPTYTLPFDTARNFSVNVFQREEIESLAVSKIKALQNLSYDEIGRLLGLERKFSLEIEGLDGLEASLNVTPGIAPRGTVILHEIPMLMQDLDGRIKEAWTRVKVW
jgi:hypothetical protein